MFEIIIQRAVTNSNIPTNKKFKKWTTSVLKKRIPSGEVTIRIVNEKEMKMLNHSYRKKNKPTNVLSFPFEVPDEHNEEIPILGDIIICDSVVKNEAKKQKKRIEAHWAHMVIHGTLHLLGYDHQKDSDAEKMESEEIMILKKLGFKNPYKEINNA